MNISIPGWETPLQRFLNGEGEVVSDDTDQYPYTLWEALIYIPEDKYPLRLDKLELSRDTLLCAAYDLLTTGSWHQEIIARGGEAALAQLIKLFKGKPLKMLIRTCMYPSPVVS